MPLNRRDLLEGAALGLAGLSPLAAARAWAAGTAPRKPNLVFILADDLGWRDTSIYGSAFCVTPNIDRLPRRGEYQGQ